MTLLLSLPPELLITVLSDLDWRDLVRCRQVCRFFKDYTDNDVSAQYKIELAVAGMEDGPPSLLTASDRLTKLRERQKAWRSFKWKSKQEYPMLGGNVWELYGGVLAQADQEGLLTVTQLPSVIRGIEEKQWKIPDMGIPIRDFSMDPAQDLLIVVENVRAGDVMTCRVHLRSLQTGAVHPAAKGGILECSPLKLGLCAYNIQTSENLLGLLVDNDDRNELLIWDWQTGALRMHLQGPEIPAFAFLSQRYILLPHYPDVGDPSDEDYDEVEDDGTCRIMVLDLAATPPQPQPTSVLSVPYLCVLLYPKFTPDSMPTSITIRSDPAPSWRPAPALKVPFSTGRADRLFVVTLEFLTGHTHTVLLSFVPASTILAAIATAALPGEPGARTVVPWDAWGPAGSRFVLAPWMRNAVWVCYVHGMRFAMARRKGVQQTVSVLDFNQLAVRRALASAAGHSEHGGAGAGAGGEGEREAEREGEGEEERRMAAGLQTAPKAWGAGRFFTEEVETRLPYFHRKKTTFGWEAAAGGGLCTAAMLSEDSLILVQSQSLVRKYKVLTF